MKIVVCIKEIVDSSLNTSFGQVSDTLWQTGLVHQLNPADAGALSQAFVLKESRRYDNVEITVISIGPQSVERYLRDGLSLGADRAIRILDEDISELTPFHKAALLSKAIAIFGADLILTGNRSLDSASGLVGPLLAARLDLPCVGEVAEFQPDENSRSVTVVRGIGKGARERVQTTLPAVLTVEGDGKKLPYASLDKIMSSRDVQITCLTLVDLGISLAELESSPVTITGLSFPRPRTKKVPTPPSSMPTFYRILKLLEGGVSKRQGKILQGNSQELAKQLFDLLTVEKIIKQAKEQNTTSRPTETGK